MICGQVALKVLVPARSLKLNSYELVQYLNRWLLPESGIELTITSDNIYRVNDRADKVL